jgi:hypothetical protein
MPARRMGCWMPRRVVSGVVIGPVGAMVAGSGDCVFRRARMPSKRPPRGSCV